MSTVFRTKTQLARDSHEILRVADHGTLVVITEYGTRVAVVMGYEEWTELMAKADGQPIPDGLPEYSAEG